MVAWCFCHCVFRGCHFCGLSFTYALVFLIQGCEWWKTKQAKISSLLLLLWPSSDPCEVGSSVYRSALVGCDCKTSLCSRVRSLNSALSAPYGLAHSLLVLLNFWILISPSGPGFSEPLQNTHPWNPGHVANITLEGKNFKSWPADPGSLILQGGNPRKEVASGLGKKGLCLESKNTRSCLSEPQCLSVFSGSIWVSHSCSLISLPFEISLSP